MVRITGSKEELDKIRIVLEDNPEFLADVQIDIQSDIQPNKAHAEVHESNSHEEVDATCTFVERINANEVRLQVRCYDGSIIDVIVDRDTLKLNFKPYSDEEWNKMNMDFENMNRRICSGCRTTFSEHAITFAAAPPD